MERCHLRRVSVIHCRLLTVCSLPRLADAAELHAVVEVASHCFRPALKLLASPVSRDILHDAVFIVREGPGGANGRSQPMYMSDPCWSICGGRASHGEYPQPLGGDRGPKSCPELPPTAVAPFEAVVAIAQPVVQQPHPRRRHHAVVPSIRRRHDDQRRSQAAEHGRPECR